MWTRWDKEGGGRIQRVALKQIHYHVEKREPEESRKVSESESRRVKAGNSTWGTVTPRGVVRSEGRERGSRGRGPMST